MPVFVYTVKEISGVINIVFGLTFMCLGLTCISWCIHFTLKLWSII